MSESEQIFEKMLSEAGIPTTEAGMRGRWDTINAEEGSQITNNSAWSPFWRLVSAIVTAPALWLVRLLVRHALPNTFLKALIWIFTVGGSTLSGIPPPTPKEPSCSRGPKRPGT